MKIVYLSSTKSDLLWLHEYYVSVFPDGTKRALAQFDVCVELLSLNPYIGKILQGEAREFIVPNTPFTFIYRIHGLYIEVIRIWDTRKDNIL